MPPTRVWNVTRQDLRTLQNALTIAQTVRNEMEADAAYAGMVPSLDEALSVITVMAQALADHLTAEGK